MWRTVAASIYPPKASCSRRWPSAEQARVTYQSEIGGIHTSVARLRADLRDAEFDLDMTTVRAPGPGFVTHNGHCVPACTWFPRRCGRSWCSCTRTIARSPQGSSKTRCNAYDPVTRLRLPSMPFLGWTSGASRTCARRHCPRGSFKPAGSMQDMGERLPGGRAVAVIEVNQDMSAYNIPGGAAAQVALYTPYWHHFAIIRRILLRMRSWQNYVFLEGH